MEPVKKFKRLTPEETVELVEQLGKPPKGVESVYGPGASGRFVAEVFAKLNGISASDYAHEADMIIDDEILTGQTYYRYRTMFPDKPFWALVWNQNRMFPRVLRDAQGRRITEPAQFRGETRQRAKRAPAFEMGPNEKAVILNPRYRIIFPMKSTLRRLDGASITELVMRQKTEATPRE